MRGLSSIIRRRWIRRSASLAMATRLMNEWQRQCESGAVTDAGAARVQRAAKFPGSERTAVQPKAMAVGTGGEPMIEDALEILRRDADAGVDDRNDDGGRRRADAYRHALFTTWHLRARVLGVADHVDEDLQYLVLVHLNERHLGEIAHHGHAVAAEGAFVHAQAVFRQHAYVQRIGDAAAFGVALLHGDDFLDVLDVGTQRRQLRDAGVTLGAQLVRELLQVGG